MRRMSLLGLVVLAGCGSEHAGAPTTPAHAEPVSQETELLRLRLTPQAQHRLGIVTALVGGDFAVRVRQTSGEIVVPPTSTSGVPIGSLADLQLLGAQQAAADGEMARAAAQARLAGIALRRAEALIREEAGSVRARDEAAAALATAQAAMSVARQQRQLLGRSIATMGRQTELWVRVPVFGTDLSAVRRGATASIRPLGGEGGATSARAVQAPPSADHAAGTVDLFYALDNRVGAYRVGQRVSVALPLGTNTTGLGVPSSAIVRDIYGGEWVYRRTAKDAFVRQRIEVSSESDGRALIARGLEQGAEVVTTGAAELFGTEFGAAH